jgi:hypothetical protein
VQAIVKLALKAPLELGMVQVAWMNFKVVIVNRNRRVLELNDDLYTLAFLPGAEGEQRVLVEAKLLQYTFQARKGGHFPIVAGLIQPGGWRPFPEGFGSEGRIPCTFSLGSGFQEPTPTRTGAIRWDRALPLSPPAASRLGCRRSREWPSTRAAWWNQ